MPQPLAYVLLHKPAGVVTTARDPHGRPTVVGLVEHEARVVPVGRLDTDTTGALLLTNDGELAHRLAHPRYEVDKVYEAEVEGEPSDEALARWPRGSSSTTGRTAPARVRRLAPSASSSRSTRAASTRSSGCSRRSATRSAASIAAATRGSLPTASSPAQWRELEPAELELLRAAILRAR